MSVERWIASADAAVSRVGDETVLLHLVTGTYFGLDPVGSRVWRGLEAGRSVEEICEAIAVEFEQHQERVREDVTAFLCSLSEHHLIDRA